MIPIINPHPMMTVSFIIPVSPGSLPEEAIRYIAALEYPTELLEVIVVTGNNPSHQRNQAALQALGEGIYFLDDDSYLHPNTLNEGLQYLYANNVGAVGGPALTYDNASFLEQLFGDVVGSYCGTGFTRTRNNAVGLPRYVRGEELVLCNLLMRKQVFEEMSGFNPLLYPNEENELFKRMRQKNYRFLYVPEMKVFHPKRKTVAAFMKQMFRYGEGRGRHVLKLFSWRDLIFFAPTGLVVYLLLLPIVFSPVALTPLLFYLIFIAVGSVVVGRRKKSVLSSCLAFFLFLMMHLSYGIGLLFGLFHSLRKNSSLMELQPVDIRKISFGSLQQFFNTTTFDNTTIAEHIHSFNQANS